jgi:hypothetical protein
MGGFFCRACLVAGSKAVLLADSGASSLRDREICFDCDACVFGAAKRGFEEAFRWEVCLVSVDVEVEVIGVWYEVLVGPRAVCVDCE